MAEQSYLYQLFVGNVRVLPNDLLQLGVVFGASAYSMMKLSVNVPRVRVERRGLLFRLQAKDLKVSIADDKIRQIFSKLRVWVMVGR